MADSELRLSRVGLCGLCTHARAIRSAKDSEFWLCQRSRLDPRYPKYPALPRRACEGFEQHEPTTP
jgi:hypothetical protein